MAKKSKGKTKIKTRKTLMKRIKVTKSGKILKKQNRTGHLKRKWTANKKHRKNRMNEVESVGYMKKIKQLLGSNGKQVKIGK